MPPVADDIDLDPTLDVRTGDPVPEELQVAAGQLAGVPLRDAWVLLLSDRVHSAGPDPRLTAARSPRLDVLLDTSGRS